MIVFIQLLLDAVSKDKPPLDKLQESFNHINFVYRDWLEIEVQNQSASPPNAPYTNAKADAVPRVLIDQNAMLEEIFQKLGSETHLEKLERILVCYFSSLAEYGIPTQFYLNRLLVSTLVSEFESSIPKYLRKLNLI